MGKRIQLAFPEASIAYDPVRRLFQWIGVETAAMHATGFFSREQSGTFQYAEMLRDRRQRHVEWIRQLRDGGLAERELFQNRAPCRVGQCGKSGIQESW